MNEEDDDKQSDSTPVHYQDTFFVDGHQSAKNGYVNFATNKSQPTEIEPEDERERLAAAKKRLFPGAVATSFSEVANTLRNERRQEFCPIYTDETTAAVVERQAKRKPIGSLLAKRIRWDDLKRKREEEERQQRYYQYGPSNPFANPYEQYYMAAQHQQDQMMDLARIQQEHSGFWPESQPSNWQLYGALQPPPPPPDEPYPY